MSAFRKITVNNENFLWSYNYSVYDFQSQSSIVYKKINSNLKIIIHLKSDMDAITGCPFNTGLHAKKEGKETLINLNQPKFIAEILNYILTNALEKDDTTIYKDGISILHTLGYEF